MDRNYTLCYGQQTSHGRRGCQKDRGSSPADCVEGLSLGLIHRRPPPAGYVRQMAPNVRIHVPRTVADTVSNSYGSEGWEFESLRARNTETTVEQAVFGSARPTLYVFVDLYPRSHPRTVLASSA